MSMITKITVNRAASRCFRSCSSNQACSAGSSTGFMGTEFSKPSDFTIRSFEVIKAANNFKQQIYKQDIPLNQKQTLIALDAISNVICSVMDVAEITRNCHTDDLFISTAHETFQYLFEYMCQLNTDHILYTRLDEIISDKEMFLSLTEEEQMFAKDLKREFELHGVNIQNDDKKKQNNDLQQHISILESKYVNSLVKPRDNEFITIGPIVDLQLYNNIQTYCQQNNQSNDHLSTRMPSAHLHIDIPCQRIDDLLHFIDDEQLRQKIWIKSMDMNRDNISTLGALIKSRQKLAHELGFSSHTERVLSQRIIRTPEACMDFLNSIANEIKPKVTQELDLLYSSLNLPFKSQLNPWDLRFLMQRFYSRQSTNCSYESISSYFSLRTCIEGLKFVTHSIFGIRVEESNILREEAWVPSDDAGVFKLTLFDSANDCLGTIYMDVFSRPKKMDQAAHMTVRCGCIDSVHYMNGILNGSNNREIKRLLPIVALLFNFKPSSPGETLLSLSNVETLYHEWGHAMHSLLSRTTFQHLSGTRGGVDFVEVPSHLFEFFSRSSSVVSQWAVHNQNGKRMPDGILEEAISQRTKFKYIEMQSQLLYSAADQIIFGPSLGNQIENSDDACFWDAMQEVSKWQTQYSNLSTTLNDAGKNVIAFSPLTHAHFIEYGGQYYSYLFAQQKAQLIWNRHFKDEPLSGKSGALIWKEMLSSGSAKDPSEILRVLL